MRRDPSLVVSLFLALVLLTLPWVSPTTASTDREFLVIATGKKLPDNFGALVSAVGGTLVREIGEIGVAVVRSASPQFAVALEAVPGVGKVAHDPQVNWLAAVVDTSSFSTVSLDPRTAPAGHDPAAAAFAHRQWNMRVIQANLAWAAGHQGSPSVRVAILDTGIDPGHLDLAGKVNAALSANFTTETSPPGGYTASHFPAGGPFHPWLDYHFHGTHVAGIVAAHGFGVAGVAPHAELIAVKVLNRFGSGTFGGVIAGIVYAANAGADVINMSLGASFPRSCLFVEEDGTKTIFPSECAALVAALNRAVNYASGQGTLVISAAGNSAVNADKDGNNIFVPAQSGNGSAVSATGPVNQAAGTFDDLAFYSNYGHSIVTVAAPGGGGIPGPAPPGNALDRVLSPCSRYTTLGLAAPQVFVCASDPNTARYLFARGTSMAAPHAAGVAALIDSLVDGSFTQAQLRARLQHSSEDLGKPGADPQYGHGRVNACRAVGVCR